MDSYTVSATVTSTVGEITRTLSASIEVENRPESPPWTETLEALFAKLRAQEFREEMAP